MSSLCPRYPWSEGHCLLIYRDPPVGDLSRRGTRHRRRHVPPGVAAAAGVAGAAEAAEAAASPPAPVPGCRRRALYRRPRCSPEAATSLEHRNTPATRPSRGGNPAGTHPPRLPGEHPRVILFPPSYDKRRENCRMLEDSFCKIIHVTSLF